MVKYYFTYGDDASFPRQNGWTEVEAENYQLAIRAFQTFHPNRPGSEALNCAGCYSDRVWDSTFMAKNNDNFGHGCWERITVFVEPISDTLSAKDNYGRTEHREQITYQREFLDG